MKTHRTLVAVLMAVISIGALMAVVPGAGPAAETPRRGGVLLAAIAADAPSLDPHQEETFATIEVVAPCYSTLLQIDPYHYPKVIGDVATEWKIAPDGLTYTFKLRPGLRFHDGSALTSADVKATYEKIVFPPAGVRSIRRNSYAAITSIEAPDANTIVFKLKHPSASLRDNFASPWNVIYPKKYLDQDPNYFKTHVIGSGPFKFKSHTRGSTFEGERNPDYFIKDRPYLDGYKFFVSTETSARAAALRSGRVYIEFRTMPQSEVEAIKKQLGDKVVVQDTPATRICVDADHRPLESASWFADGRDTGSFELMVARSFNFMDDPDQFLERYTTRDSNNWGRFSDPRIDDLFTRQSRALDRAERKKAINEIERIVLGHTYYIPGIWWARSVVHWAKVKNYIAPPNHYSNQKLQDVWLSED